MKPFVFNKTNTFCINLDSHTERWKRMQDRFSFFDMDVTRWPACGESDITSPFPSYLSNGQKGCAQSHINIWKHIVENNLEYALVIEDDACFDKQWREKLYLFCSQNTNMDWHMVFLNASEPIVPKDTWLVAREQYLTGGYLISRKSAEIILNDFSTNYYACDWMTSRDQIYGQSYCYFPWLIIQEGIDTTIGSNVDEDHQKVVRCLQEIDYSIANYI